MPGVIDRRVSEVVQTGLFPRIYGGVITEQTGRQAR